MKHILLSLFVLVCFSSSGQQVKSLFYQEQELSLKATKGGTLSGTLTIPDSRDAGQTVVIIIAGSGAMDRDGNYYKTMYTNTHKFLAHDLAQRGIPVFRYDKRGIAASVSAGTDESKLTFDDYIQDLNDWITLLKTQQKFSNIVLAGHSEGTLIALVAGKKANVNAYVLLAPSGSPVDSLIAEQINDRMPSLNEQTASILAKLKNKETVANVPPELAGLFRPQVQPFLISMMAYHPGRELAGVTAPVLLILGDNDLQIKVTEMDKLLRVKPDATPVIIAGMNHPLKISEKDPVKNLQLYNSVTTPIAKAVPDHIQAFLKKNRLIR